MIKVIFTRRYLDLDIGPYEEYVIVAYANYRGARGLIRRINADQEAPDATSAKRYVDYGASLVQ